MKVIRFFYDNLLDAATCTSSSASASYPLTNLMHDWFSKYTRTTDVSSEWWKWNLGSAKSVSGIIFKGHNFRVGSTVTLQVSSTDADTWDVLNEVIPITATMLAEELVYKFFDTPQTCWRIKLSVVDVGNPDGYLKLGRPWAGTYFEPSKNFDDAYTRGLEDLSTVNWSADGYHFATKVSPKLAALQYVFSDLTSADRLALLAVFEEVGYTDAYFLLQDADDAVNTLFYGVNLDKVWDFPHVFMDAYFNFGFSFKESR